MSVFSNDISVFAVRAKLSMIRLAQTEAYRYRVLRRNIVLIFSDSLRVECVWMLRTTTYGRLSCGHSCSRFGGHA